MKKFELTTEFITFLGRKLFRIRALIAFGNVEEGEVGGYVESENNLSQDGNAWVYGDAKVYDNAQVCGNARVYDNAKVYDNAWVYGNAKVYGNAEVCGDARVCGNADYACVQGFGSVCRNTTFFRCVDGTIGVACGCFTGTLNEFRAKVRETRGDSKFASEYLMIADLMEMHFGGGKK